MKKGHVIFLNGTSSAGKSTLSWQIQEQSDAEYYWLSNDAFTDMPHNKYYDIDRQGTFTKAITMMYKTVLLYTANGYNVIIDHVLLDDEHGRSELAECAELFREIHVTFVHVKCPLEKLKEREVKRGDREIGNAERQYKKLYPDEVYDIIVDTHSTSIENCASIVISGHEQFLKGDAYQTSFARMLKR